MDLLRQHWEEVYQQKDFEQLGWYQAEPALELEWIGPPEQDQPLIDVGAGCAFLADRLLDQGFTHATFIDLAETALKQTQARLGERSDTFRFVTADILTYPLHGQYNYWHDRAVFHFLTEAQQQQLYIDQLRSALAPGGKVFLAGFAPDGPQKCSGLPVVRHSLEDLGKLLGEEFRLIQSRKTDHHTPGGTAQAYLFSLWQRAKA